MAKASHSEESHYHRGEMDIHEQVATYSAFMAFSKWGSLALAVGLMFVILWFCTGTGFLGALITAIVLGVIGTLVLKGKKKAAH